MGEEGESPEFSALSAEISDEVFPKFLLFVVSSSFVRPS
jgi:hypothetical protein